jgi:hypothetical protein
MQLGSWLRHWARGQHPSPEKAGRNDEEAKRMARHREGLSSDLSLGKLGHAVVVGSVEAALEWRVPVAVMGPMPGMEASAG